MKSVKGSELPNSLNYFKCLKEELSSCHVMSTGTVNLLLISTVKQRNNIFVLICRILALDAAMRCLAAAELTSPQSQCNLFQPGYISDRPRLGPAERTAAGWRPGVSWVSWAQWAWLSSLTTLSTPHLEQTRAERLLLRVKLYPDHSKLKCVVTLSVKLPRDVSFQVRNRGFILRLREWRTGHRLGGLVSC